MVAMFALLMQLKSRTLQMQGNLSAYVVAVVGLPVVEHCMSGLNASVFAYGQTGAASCPLL